MLRSAVNGRVLLANSPVVSDHVDILIRNIDQGLYNFIRECDNKIYILYFINRSGLIQIEPKAGRYFLAKNAADYPQWMAEATKLFIERYSNVHNC